MSREPITVHDKDLPEHSLTLERVRPSADESASFRLTIKDECPERGSPVYILDLSLSDARRLALAILPEVGEIIVAADNLQCPCSVLERDSGHLVGCVRPALDEAIASMEIAAPEPFLCVYCGKPVEAQRNCYVHKVCYACLPPPPPLEVTES